MQVKMQSLMYHLPSDITLDFSVQMQKISISL